MWCTENCRYVHTEGETQNHKMMSSCSLKLLKLFLDSSCYFINSLSLTYLMHSLVFEMAEHDSKQLSSAACHFQPSSEAFSK